MARIIDLKFNDKTYSIEYNREAVMKIMTTRDEKDDMIEVAIKLIECGLTKHHKNDMPDRDDIVGWLLALGNELPTFVQELQKSVQEVIEVIQSEQKSKNLKWGVRK